MAKGETGKRRCFVVCPIGEEGSPERINTEWLTEEIITPVLGDSKFGFEVKRADQFQNPGEITPQVIMALLDWELVVADLTGLNPNVFYELAIRHMVRKPAIHMMRRGGDKLPFDNHTHRAIFYRRDRPEDLRVARKELEENVRAIVAPDFVVTNPVSSARGIAKLDESGDPQGKVLANLVSDVSQIRRELDTMRNFAAHLVASEERPNPYDSQVERASAFRQILRRAVMMDDGVAPPSSGFGSDLAEELSRRREALARELLKDYPEANKNSAQKLPESEDN